MNSTQECLLLLLLNKHDVSTNIAGCHLARAGLLKKQSAYVSNFCLAGSAVLRSLERQKLVGHYQSSRDQWSVKKYYLTDKGRDVAESLKPTAGK